MCWWLYIPLYDCFAICVPVHLCTDTVGVMLWAGVAIIPLLFYPWRSRLPRLWSRLGYKEEGSGYKGLAILNAIIVALFVAQEVRYGLKDRSFEYVNNLNSPQLPIRIAIF